MSYATHGLNKKYRLRIAVVLLVSALTGCASSINYVPPLTSETVPAPTEGIVVARVINASDYPAPFNQLTIAPQNLNESETAKYQELQANSSRANGTTVFASPIESGKYVLSGIGAWHSNGTYFYNEFVAGDTEMGTFSVAPGQVTDLGSLIFYKRSDGDRYFEDIIRIPAGEDDVLGVHFPFFDRSNANSLTWDDDGLADNRSTFFASAAQNPTTFDDRYLAPDKSVYFLARLGVLVKRDALGEWSLDVVDTNLSLTTIAQSTKGDLIVGGAEGRVFFKPFEGQWQDISLDPGYHIDHIEFYADDTIDLIALESKKVSIFRASAGDLGVGWRELDSYTTRAGWASWPEPEPDEKKKSQTKKPKALRQVMRTKLDEVAGRNYISVYTIGSLADPLFTQAKATIFEYSPTDWQPRIPESKPKIIESIPAGQSMLGIERPGFWSWSGKPKYSRFDASTNSWKPMNLFAYECEGEITLDTQCGQDERTGKRIASKKRSFTLRSAPWFTSDVDALAFVTFADRDIWSGTTDYSTKLLSTADGGVTWSDSGRTSPSEYCGDIVSEVADRMVLGCVTTGDFYESSDLGETWDHVRQHENF